MLDINKEQINKLNPKLAIRIIKNLMILAPIRIQLNDSIKNSFMKAHIQAQTE